MKHFSGKLVLWNSRNSLQPKLNRTKRVFINRRIFIDIRTNHFPIRKIILHLQSKSSTDVRFGERKINWIAFEQNQFSWLCCFNIWKIRIPLAGNIRQIQCVDFNLAFRNWTFRDQYEPMYSGFVKESNVSILPYNFQSCSIPVTSFINI